MFSQRIVFKYFFLLLFITLLFLPAKANAEDKGKARQEYLSGLALEFNPEIRPDYTTIARHYQSAAERGSREALLALARLSEPGGPLDKGPQVWQGHLLKAAAAGWPEAAFNLGEALGQGTLPSNPALNPAYFYMQAATAGHGTAALRLGEIYLEGSHGLERDEAQAVIWLGLAANNSEEAAALRLGQIYYEKNPPVALSWLQRTTTADGAYLLGQLYLKAGRVIEAVSSLTAAADQGQAPANLALGVIYSENDLGLRTNPRAAIRHFKIAAQAGLPEGCYELALMYLQGEATPKDPITGAFWLHQAASRGHKTAHEKLNSLKTNFTVGQLKRLERMVTEDVAPTTQTKVN